MAVAKCLFRLWGIVAVVDLASAFSGRLVPELHARMDGSDLGVAGRLEVLVIPAKELLRNLDNAYSG